MEKEVESSNAFGCDTLNLTDASSSCYYNDKTSFCMYEERTETEEPPVSNNAEENQLNPTDCTQPNLRKRRSYSVKYLSNFYILRIKSMMATKILSKQLPYYYRNTECNSSSAECQESWGFLHM